MLKENNFTFLLYTVKFAQPLLLKETSFAVISSSSKPYEIVLQFAEFKISLTRESPP